jgi:hypothetical protein
MKEKNIFKANDSALYRTECGIYLGDKTTMFFICPRYYLLFVFMRPKSLVTMHYISKNTYAGYIQIKSSIKKYHKSIIIIVVYLFRNSHSMSLG